MQSPSEGYREQLIARFPRPTSDRPTSLAVIGDPHVSTRGEGGQRLPELSEEHLRRAVADVNERSVDGVVSVGDLSANGGPWDFAAVDDIVGDLNAPFVSIPGNHDVPATSSADHEVLPQSEFERRYAGGSVPFVRRFGGVVVIGLDSMRLRRSLDGDADDDQLGWLDETLARTSEAIVMLHHPLPGIREWLEQYADRIGDVSVPTLWEHPGPLLDVLDRHDAPFVLSGHKHIPGVARTRGIWEIMAPSTCTFPQAYLRVDVGPDGTDVSFVPIVGPERLQEAFLRRYAAFRKTRMYASAGAVFLSGPPVDTLAEQV